MAFSIPICRIHGFLSNDTSIQAQCATILRDLNLKLLLVSISNQRFTFLLDGPVLLADHLTFRDLLVIDRLNTYKNAVARKEQ
ncbi:hypothetical protein GJ496_009725 [Pomphorhynchus laevis]|nr:hypothetical protein GJ496_009725 [Pomphorhynchus laevis]